MCHFCECADPHGWELVAVFVERELFVLGRCGECGGFDDSLFHFENGVPPKEIEMVICEMDLPAAKRAEYREFVANLRIAGYVPVAPRYVM